MQRESEPIPSKTFAFSNNGTPTNSNDDKQGTYTLTGQEMVTMNVAPKAGASLDMTAAKTKIDAIKAATTAAAFDAAYGSWPPRRSASRHALGGSSCA